MQVYLYQASLYCGACMIARLIAQGKAAPAACDMAPADALEQITESNGFTCESDYDSDDLPKGQYADGGGEADSPQHCDACHVFLDNPLTDYGESYVMELLAPHLESLDAAAWTQGAYAEFVAASIEESAPVLAQWARAYDYLLRDHESRALDS